MALSRCAHFLSPSPSIAKKNSPEVGLVLFFRDKVKKTISISALLFFYYPPQRNENLRILLIVRIL